MGEEGVDGHAPDRLQARLTEGERVEFYKAWKELRPRLEWAQFCREMIEQGIVLTRIEAENNRKMRLDMDVWNSIGIGRAGPKSAG
jgi:hypothetical protein